jgi:hypothetical protein
MDRHVPVRILWLTIAGLLLAVVAWHAFVSQVGAPAQASGTDPQPSKAAASAASVDVTPAAAAVTADHLLHLQPDQVLATVNRRPIRVADALPAGANQQIDISPQELKFFLDRAVDRELIFETAQKQGITLDESQNRQLAEMQAMRNQPEPGGLAKLNNDPAARQMEALDAKAFMLQTALMAARGDSPNVSEDQVLDYLQHHPSEFGNFSGQPSADMDFAIRTQLATPVRSTYNQALAAYMQQIESSADVVLYSSAQ